MRKPLSALIAGAALVALGLSGIVAPAAHAAVPAKWASIADVPTCDPEPLTRVRENQYVGSCLLERKAIGDPWSPKGETLTIRTMLRSFSSWKGFHGCVQPQLLDVFTGAIVHKAPDGRFGVNAADERVVDWTTTVPWKGRTGVVFAHGHC